MMNDDSQKQAETLIATDKPGSLLRETRLKQELSIDDIHKRLHLEASIIEAIEADDFSKVPTATYARGYLRTYAKTLGLDADYIVSLYNSDNAPPPPEILPEVKPPSQVSSSDKPVKAFTYLITLALVLLLLIWYQSNFIVDKKQDSSANEPAATTDSPEQINNTDTNFDVITHPEGWQTPETNDVETVAEPVSGTIEVTATLGNLTDSNLTINEIREEAEASQPEILPIETDNLPEQIIRTGSDTIELTISESSWIEIYDANDERIFMDLGKPDEQYAIRGTAPFSLILGYSPGVAIKFNSEEFDPEPYSNNGVARFDLPAE